MGAEWYTDAGQLLPLSRSRQLFRRCTHRICESHRVRYVRKWGRLVELRLWTRTVCYRPGAPVGPRAPKRPYPGKTLPRLTAYGRSVQLTLPARSRPSFLRQSSHSKGGFSLGAVWRPTRTTRPTPTLACLISSGSSTGCGRSCWSILRNEFHERPDGLGTGYFRLLLKKSEILSNGILSMRSYRSV